MHTINSAAKSDTLIFNLLRIDLKHISRFNFLSIKTEKTGTILLIDFKMNITRK